MRPTQVKIQKRVELVKQHQAPWPRVGEPVAYTRNVPLDSQLPTEKSLFTN